MAKIKVKPEGRPDMWLVQDKESLVEFIRSKGLKEIHNFVQSGHTVIGADHSVDNVLKDIDKAERLAVITDPNANMGHAMAIADVKLEMYDIGPITVDDLEIEK